MFDFDKELSKIAAQTNTDRLGALVLGPSGAGKSTLLGTFGCKTLYLYTTGEDHGPDAASAMPNADIQPWCINTEDGNVTGTELTPDATYSRLLEILGSADSINKNGIGAVIVDSATEVEAIIRGTTEWAAKCKTAKGSHNAFLEGSATIDMFRPIINALKRLQREADIHFAMTCALNVTELGQFNAISEATPKLQSYSVAETVTQQFADIIVVGRMSRNNEVKHKIQFMTTISKTANDQHGNLKKALNFNPRLSGKLLDELPDLVEADLSKVIELKLA